MTAAKAGAANASYGTAQCAAVGCRRYQMPRLGEAQGLVQAHRDSVPGSIITSRRQRQTRSATDAQLPLPRSRGAEADQSDPACDRHGCRRGTERRECICETWLRGGRLERYRSKVTAGLR